MCSLVMSSFSRDNMKSFNLFTCVQYSHSGWFLDGTVQTNYNLNRTCMCFRVKMQNVCARVSPHVATPISFCSTIIIANLRP